MGLGVKPTIIYYVEAQHEAENVDSERKYSRVHFATSLKL
jgi:hypothetical protein